MQIIETISGRCIFRETDYALDFKSRLTGLIGRSSLAEDYAVYFPRCSSVHTCFMRIPIDIIYIDAGIKIIKTVRNMKPWRFSCCPGACGVIESAGGVIDGKKITEGMKLQFV